MIDLVQVQRDLTGLLLSDERLNNITIRSHRQMRVDNELDWHVLVDTVRNGRSGAGVLVAFPHAGSGHPHVTGPVMDWVFPVVSIEHDALNNEPTRGTLMSCETLAQHVHDLLHLYADDNLGTFQLRENAFEPEKEFVFEGCIAYRSNLHLSAGHTLQTPRVATIQVANNTGTITLTSATSGAEIRYTINDADPTLNANTFPGRDPAGNPSSLIYTAPFTVESGQVVRAMGYKDDLINSALRHYVVP